MPSTPIVHHFIEEAAHAVGIGAVEERRVGGHAEAALHGLLDAFNRDVVSAFAADGEIVVLALAVEVNREGQVLRRRELRQAALQFERVGAQVDVLLARDQPVDDLDDLRMQQRLAAGDGHHGRAALFHCGEALFGREHASSERAADTAPCRSRRTPGCSGRAARASAPADNASRRRTASSARSWQPSTSGR